MMQDIASPWFELGAPGALLCLLGLWVALDGYSETFAGPGGSLFAYFSNVPRCSCTYLHLGWGFVAARVRRAARVPLQCGCLS